MVTATFPSEADVVIVGAGVVSACHVDHLAEEGVTDVVVLDKGDPMTPESAYPYIGCASNHSSGLMAPISPGSRLNTQSRMYAIEYLSEIPGCYNMTGMLEFASEDDRVRDLIKRQKFGSWCGVESHMISPLEAQEFLPFLDVESVKAALYIPSGGFSDVTFVMEALMKRAQDRGAPRVYTNTEVTGLDIRDGRIRGVHTNREYIKTSTVIVCAGVWSNLITEMAGVTLPMLPLEHGNMTLGPFPGPELEGDDDVGQIVWRHQGIGVYGKRRGRQYEYGDYSEEFPVVLLDPANIEDWRTFKRGFTVTMKEFTPEQEIAYLMGPVKRASRLLPFTSSIFTEHGWRYIARKGFNGLVPVSHDEGPFVGEIPGIKGLLVGGRGWYNEALAMARMNTEFIVHGRTKWESFENRASRSYRHMSMPGPLADRCEENQRWTYALTWPNAQYASARETWVSPFYPRTKELGALVGGSCWEAVLKERPHWYEDNDDILQELLREGHYIPTRQPGTEEAANWSRIIGAEHLWQRMHAAVTDLSSFFIFDVMGPGALAFMQYMVVHNVDVAWPNEDNNFTGKAVYTPFLDEAGQVKGDFVVQRLGENHFRVITGAAVGMDNFQWFEDHKPRDGSVDLKDKTMQLGEDTNDRLCVMSLWGPSSWDILKAACGEEARDDKFHYLNHKEVTIAGVVVRIFRISFTGDPGVEIAIPWDEGLKVWDAIWKAGESHRLISTGLGTYVGSASLEKLYGLWGLLSEFNTEHNPFELGMFLDEPTYGEQGMTKFKRPDFIGKRACIDPSVGHRGKVPVRRLCTMRIEYPMGHPGRVPIGNWPILHPEHHGMFVAGKDNDGKNYNSATLRVDTAYSLSAAEGKHIVLVRGLLPEWYARVGNEVDIDYYDNPIRATVMTIGSTPLYDPENTFART